MIIYNLDEIERIKEALLRGDIIAFGTDTVFGLACIYDDIKAIEKIFMAKSREPKKALPMMCESVRMIEEVAHVSDKAKRVMSFMPGAITIIFKKKEVISDYVTSNKDTIGIRIPDDEWIIELIRKVGKPLLVTSANISGEPSLFKWEEVKEKLDGRIDGIVKKDALGYASSTIVDCSSDDIKILREGPVLVEEIMKVVGK